MTQTFDLDKTQLSKVQFATIAICFLMNMLDGMDVTVVSYAAPSIAKGWAVTPQVLGIVFSAGLLGMAIGGMFLAPIADYIGRRNIIIISAIIMGISVFLTSFCQNVEQLMVFRFISGLGIGSMLASTATLAAEYAPTKTKDFWVSVAVSGYPVGAVLMGLLTAYITPIYGWEMVFKVAGVLTFITLPFVFIFLSESLDYLLKSQPKNALKQANEILVKMNEEQLTTLPVYSKEEIVKKSVASILSKNLKNPTIRLWIAIFMCFATLYFLTSWIPKLATIAGLSLSLAIYAGTVFNVGAFFGIISQGYLSARFGLTKTICAYLIGTAFLMIIFGFFQGSDLILVLFGLIGFGIQGGFVGMYSVAARLYPTEVRATGVGWAVGLGRIGAIVGPFVGGLLIASGLSMTTNFIIFSVPLIISGVATLLISFGDSEK